MREKQNSSLVNLTEDRDVHWNGGKAFIRWMLLNSFPRTTVNRMWKRYNTYYHTYCSLMCMLRELRNFL